MAANSMVSLSTEVLFEYFVFWRCMVMLVGWDFNDFTQYISIMFEHSLFNGYLVINAGN